MKRSMFVVVVLMAAVAAYGGDRSVEQMGFDAQHFAGPVCLPGDPCGPGGVQINASPDKWIVDEFIGPVCLPGDPCGPHVLRAANFTGPVCLPGDPCGPGGLSQRGTNTIRFKVHALTGPVCLPKEPCGPGSVKMERI